VLSGFVRETLPSIFTFLVWLSGLGVYHPGWWAPSNHSIPDWLPSTSWALAGAASASVATIPASDGV